MVTTNVYQINTYNNLGEVKSTMFTQSALLHAKKIMVELKQLDRGEGEYRNVYKVVAKFAVKRKDGKIPIIKNSLINFIER